MTSEPLTNRWVTLEPLAAGHFDALRAAAADPRLWALTLRNGCGDGFTGWFADAPGANRVAYVVRTPAGEVMGSTSLLDLNPHFRTVEIGNTWYAVAAQGTAVNPASKRLLLGHCFDTLGMNRVQFQVDARNARSQAAVLKLGATREGLLRKHKITYTGWVRDTVVFSIVADEWPAVRERLDERLAGFAGLAAGTPLSTRPSSSRSSCRNPSSLARAASLSACRAARPSRSSSRSRISPTAFSRSALRLAAVAAASSASLA